VRLGAIQAVLLEATDLARSEHFYGDVVGLEPCGRDVWPGDAPNTCFRAESGQYVVLVQRPEVPADGMEVHLQLYLSLEHWAVVAARLQELGIQPRDERKKGLRAVGELAAHVHDPDGHVLELTAAEPRAYEVPPAGRGKVAAGRIDDFAILSVTRIPQAQCFLIRDGDGSFLALSQVCTHMQFTVSYQPEHYRFHCPRHRYRFGLNGACLPRPGRGDAPPLHTYAIEFDGDQILIDTDVSIARSEAEVDCVTRVPETSGTGAR
jgi:nitrite reductase/ring-hydroxylating ferredoxin subunit/catechol 2,3-dioxygenase-like lactoylglutathione lyase family enzyme